MREMLDCASSAGLPRAERAQLIELQRTCSAQTPAVIQVPAPSPPPQQLEVTCAREISALQVGTRARTKFERDFKEGIGAAAGVPPARVVVDSIRGGSVVVSCHIGPAVGGGGVSAAGAVAALQRAFAAGSVRVAGETLPPTALEMPPTNAIFSGPSSSVRTAKYLSVVDHMMPSFDLLSECLGCSWLQVVVVGDARPATGDGGAAPEEEGGGGALLLGAAAALVLGAGGAVAFKRRKKDAGLAGGLGSGSDGGYVHHNEAP